MARKSGRVGALLIQADGAGGSAGWDEVVGKRDMTLTVESNEAEVSGTESFDLFVQGGHALTIEGTIVTDPADDEWAALQTAFETRATLGFWGVDFNGTGGKGWKFDGVVTRFNQAKNRTDGQMTSVTIRPTPSATAPAYATIAGGG